MRKIFSIIAVILMSVALVGCGATEGEVVSKEYKKAYLASTFVKSGDVLVPVMRKVKECYRIDIITPDGKKGNDCVPEDVFNSVEVGDWINF